MVSSSRLPRNSLFQWALTLGLVLLPGSRWADAGEGLMAWSFRVQGTVDMRPGNDYFAGPSLYYSNYNVFNHKLQLGASFLTNRPEAAWRRGVPVQDWYLLTPLWHWKRNGFFDPTFQMDMGWTWFDDEGLGLDNTAFIVAPSLGVNFNINQGRYGLHTCLGYQAITSSLVNPGLALVEIWAMF